MTDSFHPSPPGSGWRHEVILTLFRIPDMDDAGFARVQRTVAENLATLKRLLDS